jgi:hypothetical protein
MSAPSLLLMRHGTFAARLAAALRSRA